MIGGLIQVIGNEHFYLPMGSIACLPHHQLMVVLVDIPQEEILLTVCSKDGTGPILKDNIYQLLRRKRC